MEWTGASVIFVALFCCATAVRPKLSNYVILILSHLHFLLSIKSNLPGTQVSPLIELLTSGNFTMFRDELVKYNLTDIISSSGVVIGVHLIGLRSIIDCFKGFLTVFAPVNEAFLPAPNGTRRSYEWTEMSNENRIRILRRCFVIGTKFLSVDMKNDMELRSASGEQLRINLYPGVR